MHNPLVSIIIPNYNHALFLQERLDSVFNQTFQDFEVILLDDKSTDNSKKIISQYSKNTKVSHCVFNEVNSGSTFAQWNKGIELAKGEFIWIAESDDYCELNFLEQVIRPLIVDSKVVLSYAQSYSVNKEGTIIGSWLDHTNDLDKRLFLKNFIIEGNVFIEKYLLYKNVIPNASAVLLRKEHVLKVGKLNEDYKLRTTGDWSFYFKLLLNSKIAFNATPLNAYRQHEKSVIAMQSKANERLHIINVLLHVRGIFSLYLEKRKINNIHNIFYKNKHIVYSLKYEKAILLINRKEYLNGVFHLCKIFYLFIKYSSYRKDLLTKLSKF